MTRFRFLLLFFTGIFAFSTAADAPAGYYASASGKTGNQLKSALHEIINDHYRISYTAVWDALMELDEDPANSANVLLIYSRISRSKASHGGSSGDWNREHTWPKSLGFPAESNPAYTDVHHLRPSDMVVNSTRGNKDYDDGGSRVSSAPLCFTDSDSFEPPDEVKGDLARGIFYMAVRYEGDRGNESDLELVENPGATDSGIPHFARLSTLLRWHAADPVSSGERRRNDLIYNYYQYNRNPFIDHPEWVAAIWGGSSATPPPPQERVTIFSDSFSSSGLKPEWSTGGIGNWRVRLTTDYSPRGSYHAVLDASTSGSYATSRLTFNGDLSGYEDIMVEYYYKEYGDENHSYDGLYIYNGRWIRVFSFNDGPSSYTRYHIDLSGYSGITALEWQQYDNYPVSSDGICIDDVVITGVPR